MSYSVRYNAASVPAADETEAPQVSSVVAPKKTKAQQACKKTKAPQVTPVQAEDPFDLYEEDAMIRLALEWNTRVPEIMSMSKDALQKWIKSGNDDNGIEGVKKCFLLKQIRAQVDRGSKGMITAVFKNSFKSMMDDVNELIDDVKAELKKPAAGATPVAPGAPVAGDGGAPGVTPVAPGAPVAGDGDAAGESSGSESSSEEGGSSGSESSSEEDESSDDDETPARAAPAAPAAAGVAPAAPAVASVAPAAPAAAPAAPAAKTDDMVIDPPVPQADPMVIDPVVNQLKITIAAPASPHVRMVNGKNAKLLDGGKLKDNVFTPVSRLYEDLVKELKVEPDAQGITLVKFRGTSFYLSKIEAFYHQDVSNIASEKYDANSEEYVKIMNEKLRCVERVVAANVALTDLREALANCNNQEDVVAQVNDDMKFVQGHILVWKFNYALEVLPLIEPKEKKAVKVTQTLKDAVTSAEAAYLQSAGAQAIDVKTLIDTLVTANGEVNMNVALAHYMFEQDAQKQQKKKETVLGVLCLLYSGCRFVRVCKGLDKLNESKESKATTDVERANNVMRANYMSDKIAVEGLKSTPKVEWFKGFFDIIAEKQESLYFTKHSVFMWLPSMKFDGAYLNSLQTSLVKAIKSFCASISVTYNVAADALVKECKVLREEKCKDTQKINGFLQAMGITLAARKEKRAADKAPEHEDDDAPGLVKKVKKPKAAKAATPVAAAAPAVVASAPKVQPDPIAVLPREVIPEPVISKLPEQKWDIRELKKKVIEQMVRFMGPAVEPIVEKELGICEGYEYFYLPSEEPAQALIWQSVNGGIDVVELYNAERKVFENLIADLEGANKPDISHDELKTSLKQLYDKYVSFFPRFHRIVKGILDTKYNTYTLDAVIAVFKAIHALEISGEDLMCLRRNYLNSSPLLVQKSFFSFESGLHSNPDVNSMYRNVNIGRWFMLYKMRTLSADQYVTLVVEGLTKFMKVPPVAAV